MKIKVALVTSSRSDYGPSYWLIHDFFDDPRFEALLFVSGTHLSAKHGQSISEIERDGWPIAQRIPFLEERVGDSLSGQAAGHALTSFADAFARHRPSIVVLYGDRFELLPIASAAVINRIPIAHLCGGDVTEGAFDEQIRHALTKLSHLHFPSTERSAKRILQMGESRWRVHHVGDPALDHFVRGEFDGPEELEKRLGFIPDRRTLLVTYHPVTLEKDKTPEQAEALADALSTYSESVVITAPSADPGREAIEREFRALAKVRPNIFYFESLGSRTYRGLLKEVGAVVGNSSSGLIESASAALPAVNIGIRQQGRERACNVIDAEPSRHAIATAIERALSESFRQELKSVDNPYGDGRSAPRVIEILSRLPDQEELLLKKFEELSVSPENNDPILRQSE